MKFKKKIYEIWKKNRSFLLLVFLLLAFRWSFADQYHVPTGSMLPTIQLGDRILTNKLAYDFKIPFTEYSLLKTGEPRRGDIAVFLYPKDPSQNFVKRIIGVPGDHIRIQNGWVIINNLLLMGHSFGDADFIVPNDQYFAMGDNRENSLDSRYWGFVPRKNLKGKALAVLFNFRIHNWLPSSNLDRIGRDLNNN